MVPAFNNFISRLKSITIFMRNQTENFIFGMNKAKTE